MRSESEHRSTRPVAKRHRGNNHGIPTDIKRNCMDNLKGWNE